MKICPVVVDKRKDGQIDRQIDEANTHFCNFANAPNNQTDFVTCSWSIHKF